MLFTKRELATEPGYEASEKRNPLMGMRRRMGSTAKSRDGERQAFEALLEQCWDPLWRYAYHTTGNAEDAGDLLSETAIGGFKDFAKFRGETTFLRWMYRIMTTTRIDMLRSARRHTASSLDTFDENSERRSIDIADDSGNPETIVLKPMLSDPVQHALNALSEEYRSVVVLADMEQMDYIEVSQALGVPIGTVRSRLHRARLQLRKALSNYVEERW
jgi:RNA polymerase sigma-70 factor (ECF subfamily)